MNSNILENNLYTPKFIYNDDNTKTVLSELLKDLESCKSFFLSVAFITNGGLSPFLKILKELDDNNIKGQILTTDYLCFNDPQILDKINKEYKNISLKIYVTDPNTNKSKSGIGFHTKGYIFEGNDDKYTIIIGSSNLTINAIKTNKEWNTKIVVKRNDEFATNILEEFNKYWNSKDSFVYSDYHEIYEERYKIVKEQKRAAFSKNSNIVSKETYELRPNDMQVKFINSLKKMISNGAKRALLISATGTGKTYASAFALRELKSEKALFVVHREQIAKQAMKSFNIVFNDSKKTAIFSGTQKDIEGAEYIFATVQTLSKQENLKKVW